MGVGWGWGSKVFAEKAPSSGEADGCHTVAGRMVTQQTSAVKVGGSNPGLPSVFDRGGGGGGIFGRAGFLTADQKLRGLLHYHLATASLASQGSPHCLGPCLPLTKKPKLCVTFD